MSLTVTCPDCDKTLKVKEEVAGKKIRCPGCSTVISIPKKSKESDDDFLSDLDEVAAPKRKRSAAAPVEDYEDYDESPDEKPRSRKPAKKKTRRSKSSGSNWLLIGGIAGGLVAVLFLVVLIAAIGQASKAVANRAGQLANWPTFRHPSGSVQIDMPGVPTIDPKQSFNGTQTYALSLANYRMSLTSAPLAGPAQIAMTTNPAAADLIFNEIQTKTPQQIPGARLISARRLVSGSIQGLEMKIVVAGNINLMRFYLFPNALIGAEFITRNESASSADRERYFNSIRGPDGNLINNPAQSPIAPPANASASIPVAIAPGAVKQSLTDARRSLKTKLVRQEKRNQPVPDPPQALARSVRYDAPSGQLTAYVTTIPPDGKKHPAIVWITGGDCNSIDDGFFKDSPPSNDQTASAFRKAGIVTMYPSLRGGNNNPGFKESFFGEVDDVLAAADFLSKQAGIDPARVYLGGHSSGGTLALLVAESTNRFRAIFSFGPTDDIRGYGDEFLYFDSRIAAELEVRTPALWIDSIQNRTFILEGAQRPGNVVALQSLSRKSRNAQALFLTARRANHFNILAPVTKLIADKILRDEGPTTNITLTEAELNLKYSP